MYDFWSPTKLAIVPLYFPRRDTEHKRAQNTLKSLKIPGRSNDIQECILAVHGRQMSTVQNETLATTDFGLEVHAA